MLLVLKRITLVVKPLMPIVKEAKKLSLWQRNKTYMEPLNFKALGPANRILYDLYQQGDLGPSTLGLSIVKEIRTSEIFRICVEK